MSPRSVIKPLFFVRVFLFGVDPHGGTRKSFTTKVSIPKERGHEEHEGRGKIEIDDWRLAIAD
jgi:hypothetical protein